MSDNQPLNVLELTLFQQQQIDYWRQQLLEAEQAVAAATALQEKTQAHANSFLSYCARELGVTVGRDGWTWDQNHMCFVQMPEAKKSEEG